MERFAERRRSNVCSAGEPPRFQSQGIPTRFVQLNIPEERSIICGLAVGYPDPDFPANKLHVARDSIGKNVVFIDS